MFNIYTRFQTFSDQNGSKTIPFGRHIPIYIHYTYLYTWYSGVPPKDKWTAEKWTTNERNPNNLRCLRYWKSQTLPAAINKRLLSLATTTAMPRKSDFIFYLRINSVCYHYQLFQHQNSRKKFSVIVHVLCTSLEYAELDFTLFCGETERNECNSRASHCTRCRCCCSFVKPIKTEWLAEE